MSSAADQLRAALAQIASQLGAPGTEFAVERPREESHGDFSTNLAMQLARALKQKPRDLANAIIAKLDLPDLIAKTEIAGPGFINFFVKHGALSDIVGVILKAGAQYGRAAQGQAGQGTKVNVEFVSANPTGPLHVGHGRGAALGDAIATLLEATGHAVTREFYVNDAGVQINKLVASLEARLKGEPVAEGGYQGEYLIELADAARRAQPADLRAWALDQMLAEQRRDLAEFGVKFDVWASEQAMYERQRIEATLKDLTGHGLTFDEGGALWLATSRFGDDKDRVLRKQDGTFTYFLPDIAYHRDKHERGFTRAIDIWGADHHGYVPRMRAALMGLGYGEHFFDAVLVQLVKVLRDGVEVKFSKRSGDFITLRELFEDAGVDATRYFFLQRKGDSQFVFDVDLARRQTDENPVYYVQYAHTRMAGIFRTADVDPTSVTVGFADLAPLTEPSEQDLLKQLAEYPEVVSRAAASLEPHRVITYLEEVARLVNAWYHHCRVVGEPAPVERARLMLARAAQIVLANGLTLMGISAPERM
ncbi:MAG: arginine--tRNA ligase [Gemmatimonadales bacterium]